MTTCKMTHLKVSFSCFFVSAAMANLQLLNTCHLFRKYITYCSIMAMRTYDTLRHCTKVRFL